MMHPINREAVAALPREASPAMLDSAVAFALNVSLGGDYTWSQYMADLWRQMVAAHDREALQASKTGDRP